MASCTLSASRATPTMRPEASTPRIINPPSVLAKAQAATATLSKTDEGHCLNWVLSFPPPKSQSTTSTQSIASLGGYGLAAGAGTSSFKVESVLAAPLSNEKATAVTLLQHNHLIGV